MKRSLIFIATLVAMLLRDTGASAAAVTDCVSATPLALQRAHRHGTAATGVAGRRRGPGAAHRRHAHRHHAVVRGRRIHRNATLCRHDRDLQRQLHRTGHRPRWRARPALRRRSRRATMALRPAQWRASRCHSPAAVCSPTSATPSVVASARHPMCRWPLLPARHRGSTSPSVPHHPAAAMPTTASTCCATMHRSRSWSDAQYRDWPPLREADLLHVTALDEPPRTDIQAGWFIELHGGDVLTASLTVAGRTVFAIADTPSTALDGCRATFSIATADLVQARVLVDAAGNGVFPRWQTAPQTSASRSPRAQPARTPPARCAVSAMPGLPVAMSTSGRAAPGGGGKTPNETQRLLAAGTADGGGHHRAMLTTHWRWPGYASVMRRRAAQRCAAGTAGHPACQERHVTRASTATATPSMVRAATRRPGPDRHAPWPVTMDLAGSISEDGQRFLAPPRVPQPVGRQSADQACALFTTDETGRRTAADGGGRRYLTPCWR